MTPEEARQREAAKEALSGRPPGAEQEAQEIRFDIPGITDIRQDRFGRIVIGEDVVSDGTSIPDEEESEEFLSPAERQRRYQELDVEDDPGIYVDPPEQLPPAMTTPCRECGYTSDLRHFSTNITGVCRGAHDGTLGLSWTCRCGSANEVHGSVLPPDLIAQADGALDLLLDVADLCERDPFKEG